MEKIAAFHWNREGTLISFKIISVDRASNQILILDAPQLKKGISTIGDATREIGVFCALLKSHATGGLVEHHTANPGTMPPPDRFSLDVRTQLEASVAACPNWSIKKDVIQSMSREKKRIKLKKGLIELDFWSGRHGTTYEIDLWSIAMHAKNPKKCLEKLWRARKGLLARWTTPEKQDYERWYQSIAA